MSTPPATYNSYLLIDNSQLATARRYAEQASEARPPWLLPIYDRKALEASPLLLDMEAAWEHAQLDEAMDLLNVETPALHLSVLNTCLGHAELAQHLRRFIFVLADDGKEYTLRFADCLVLAALPAALTIEQWTTLTAPLISWCVHDRTGSIKPLALPVPDANTTPTPLRLTAQQFATLTEAMEPDHFLAKVRARRHDARLPGDLSAQHEWARLARNAWHTAGNTNNLILLFLTEAALETEGKILRSSKVNELLSTPELGVFRAGLDILVENIRGTGNVSAQIR